MCPPIETLRSVSTRPTRVLAQLLITPLHSVATSPGASSIIAIRAMPLLEITELDPRLPEPVVRRTHTMRRFTCCCARTNEVYEQAEVQMAEDGRGATAP